MSKLLLEVPYVKFESLNQVIPLNTRCIYKLYALCEQYLYFLWHTYSCYVFPDTCDLIAKHLLRDCKMSVSLCFSFTCVVGGLVSGKIKRNGKNQTLHH